MDCSVLVFLPALGDVVGERIIGVWCAQECLDGEKDGTDLEGGRPVTCSCQFSFPSVQLLVTTLQDVQADAAKSVNVWMVDLGEKADFGWCLKCE